MSENHPYYSPELSGPPGLTGAEMAEAARLTGENRMISAVDIEAFAPASSAESLAALAREFGAITCRLVAIAAQMGAIELELERDNRRGA